jgi:hypothetical protein
MMVFSYVCYLVYAGSTLEVPEIPTYGEGLIISQRIHT